MARLVNHFRWYHTEKNREEEDHFYDDPTARLLDHSTEDHNIQIKPETQDIHNHLSINSETLAGSDSEDIIVEGTVVKKDRSGERMMFCCLRATLSLLHVVMGLMAGFISVYSLLDWDQPNHCLPPLVDSRGQAVEFENGLPVICDSLVYAMCAMCAFNFLMLLVLNFMWKRPCVSFTHLLLSAIFLALSVLGGAMLTVYYMAWCDSLEQYHRTRGGSGGCWEAAASNVHVNGTYITMPMYKTRLEIKQISIWALFPLSLFAVGIYAILIRIVQNTNNLDEVPSGQYRYVIMHEEAAPPVRNDRDRPSSSTSNPNHSEIANQSTASINSFDE